MPGLSHGEIWETGGLHPLSSFGMPYPPDNPPMNKAIRGDAAFVRLSADIDRIAKPKACA